MPLNKRVYQGSHVTKHHSRDGFKNDSTFIVLTFNTLVENVVTSFVRDVVTDRV